MRRCKPVCVYVLLAVFFCYPLVSRVFASAKIDVPFDTWDFGEVEEGAELFHEFEIYNLGDARLTLGNIQVPCGCAANQLLSSIIPPGGRSVVQVRCEAGERDDSFEKTVTLYSNDIYNPKALLTVTGKVIGLQKPKIVIEDQVKDLGVFFPGQGKDFSVTIRNDGMVPLKLQSFSGEEGVSCKSDLSAIVLESHESRKIDFSLSPKVAKGAFSTTIVIGSDDPARPNDYVRLKGYMMNAEAVMIYAGKDVIFVVNGLDKSIVMGRIFEEKGEKKNRVVESLETYKFQRKGSRQDIFRLQIP